MLDKWWEIMEHIWPGIMPIEVWPESVLYEQIRRDLGGMADQALTWKEDSGLGVRLS